VIDLDRLMALDEEKRGLTTRLDDMRRERNAVSKEIGQKKRAQQDTAEPEEQMRSLGQRIKSGEEREKELERAAWELLEEFQLADLAYEMPKNLSYGVERRVEIARALSLKPDLLMLDEPAAGLSSADVTELIHYIRWIKENFNLTIWMIEHQMQVIMTLCSTIKVVDFGKELMTGTPDEVRSNPAVIKAYLGEGEI